MIKTEDLDFAIDQTLQKYPESYQQLAAEMLTQIRTGVRTDKFTRQNGARARVKNMSEDDLLKYFIDECIKSYNAASYFYYYDPSMTKLQTVQEKMQYLIQVFPHFAELQKIVTIIANPLVNCSLFFKANQNDLFELISSVVEMRFQPNSTYREYIDKYGLVQTVLDNGKSVDLFAKASQDIARTAAAKNVRVNYAVINYCFEDLMNGNQLKNQRNEYALDGTLYASQDMGKKRKNQEDCVTLIFHPENPNFKLLAVSDGMGGVELGEKASMYTLQEITKWFTSLPRDLYYYPDQVIGMLNNKIEEISNEIYKTYNADFKSIRSGATFVGAIIADKQTIISSVGDSRAYVTSRGNLELITRDESGVWPPQYSARDLGTEYIDDIRFNKNSNKIRRCIGQEFIGPPQSYIINNEDYDRLLLFTDGVTDLLDQERIKVLSLNLPPEQLTKFLVNEAIYNNAVRAQGQTEEYNGVIQAGKDNATAAAYIRR